MKKRDSGRLPTCHSPVRSKGRARIGVYSSLTPESMPFLHWLLHALSGLLPGQDPLPPVPLIPRVPWQQVPRTGAFSVPGFSGPKSLYPRVCSQGENSLISTVEPRFKKITNLAEVWAGFLLLKQSRGPSVEMTRV